MDVEKETQEVMADIRERGNADGVDVSDWIEFLDSLISELQVEKDVAS